MLGKGGWSYVVRYEARGRLIYFIVSLQNILNNGNKIYFTVRYSGWSEGMEPPPQPVKIAYMSKIYITKKSINRQRPNYRREIDINIVHGVIKQELNKKIKTDKLKIVNGTSRWMR